MILSPDLQEKLLFATLCAYAVYLCFSCTWLKKEKEKEKGFKPLKCVTNYFYHIYFSFY